MVERSNCRAATGGTGAEKVGGNYGASLLASENCVTHGFDQPLWLDPASRENIEELSAMNFMAVIDGGLHTPALSGSLLEGVTRSSLLTLAKHLGIETTERVMPVDELLRDIKTGRCTELFACGTGAIVAPIGAIGEADGTKFDLPAVNRMSSQLRDALLDIQQGKSEDRFGWVVDATDLKGLTRYIETGVSR
jgi:branched-chain amino acid aminotransferase